MSGTLARTSAGGSQDGAAEPQSGRLAWLTPVNLVIIITTLVAFGLRLYYQATRPGFLMGVTEFYRARTDTKMTIAAERLAVIAAITLPITSLSSVVGMNVIVNDQTHYLQLSIVLFAMVTISLALLRWARRQGWW